MNIKSFFGILDTFISSENYTETRILKKVNVVDFIGEKTIPDYTQIVDELEKYRKVKGFVKPFLSSDSFEALVFAFSYLTKSDLDTFLEKFKDIIFNRGGFPSFMTRNMILYSILDSKLHQDYLVELNQASPLTHKVY